MTDPLNSVIPPGMDRGNVMRAIFSAHFVLTTLVLFSDWAGQAYLFYNTFFLAGLIWALSVPATESDLPMLKSLSINIFAILLDIFVMCKGGTRHDFGQGWNGLALAAAILNLLLRVPTSLMLHRIRNERQTLRYDNFDTLNQEQMAGSHPSSVIIGNDSYMAEGGRYNYTPLGGPGHFEDDTKPIAP